ncbi:MAG: phage holin, LLH family, partial [Anaerolineae bacterium]
MPASELSQSLQIFANLLLVIALPIVLAAAFQHLRVMSRQLQERIGEERWQRIDQVVTAAVRFAEQAGVVEGLVGAEKKQMEVDYVQRKLADYGVTGIDVAAIADLVVNEVR